MTRNERIAEAYRGGDVTIRELAQMWGVSLNQVGRILREAGVLKVRDAGRPRSPIPEHMRKAFVGDLTMSPLQIAYAVHSRLERTRGADLVYVLHDKGRVYAPINKGAVEEFADDRPELLVGCYAKGFEVADLADDLESVRGGAA